MKKVLSASAVITALITIVGIADTLKHGKLNYGSNGFTQREVLLQLSVMRSTVLLLASTVNAIDLGFDLYKKKS